MAWNAGQFDCLAYAMEHDCIVEDDALAAAVNNGHLTCVELLVACGLPRELPYVQPARGSRYGSVPDYGLPREPYGQPRTSCLHGNSQPSRLLCLQHLVDKGVLIHPRTLMTAVQCGDVDAVRLLHAGGVPLWEGAWEYGQVTTNTTNTTSRPLCEGESEGGPVNSNSRRIERLIRHGVLRGAEHVGQPHGAHGGHMWSALATEGRRTARDAMHADVAKGHFLENNVIAVPRNMKAAEHMWDALRYGWTMGAALPPAMVHEFESRRAATRAVLLCFSVAARRSPESVSREQAAAWSAMGRVSMELTEQILLRANLEIPESMFRGLPRHCSVGVLRRHTLLAHEVWVRSTAAFVGSSSRNEDR